MHNPYANHTANHTVMTGPTGVPDVHKRDKDAIYGSIAEDKVKKAKAKLDEFDHGDEFFARGEAGLEEYVGLIGRECHADVVEALGEVAVGAADGADHEKKVREILEREWKKFLRRNPS